MNLSPTHYARILISFVKQNATPLHPPCLWTIQMIFRSCERFVQSPRHHYRFMVWHKPLVIVATTLIREVRNERSALSHFVVLGPQSVRVNRTAIIHPGAVNSHLIWPVRRIKAIHRGQKIIHGLWLRKPRKSPRYHIFIFAL